MVKTNFLKANFLLILLALVSLSIGIYIHQRLTNNNQSAKIMNVLKSNE